MGNFYAGYQATLYYVLESVEGETPTDPAYLNLAQKTEVTISQQPSPNVVALSGSVDNATIQKGVENPIATFTLNPNQSSGQAFLKAFSSVDTSFTLLLQIDNSTVFARMTGCKVKRRSDSLSVYPTAGVLECSFEVWGWTIEFTNGLGSGTLEAVDPTVINWSDCSLTKDAVPVTDWWNFSWSVDNDIFRNRDSNGITTCLKRGRRNVTGNWTRSSSDTQLGQTELTEAKDATAIDLIFSINADLYSFTNSANSEASVSHPITDMVGISQSFIAGTFAIT